MSVNEFEDPAREREWIREQRAVVLEYLIREEVEHAGVPEDPAWFIASVIAIWRVGSRKREGAVGWWAISGDVPTDYVSSSEVRSPRAALRVFGTRWAKASKQMARGEEPDEFRIGRPEQNRDLAPMLASRAKMMTEMAADDELWS